YLDDKASEEQKAALPQLLGGLFGPMNIKNAKAPAFVPIKLDVAGDVARLDVGSGKMTAEIENIKIGETKTAKGTEPKRYKIDGAAAFPWVTGITQGKSHSFKYSDGATKWDYKDRNAFFGVINAKGTVAAAEPAKKAEK